LEETVFLATFVWPLSLLLLASIRMLSEVFAGQVVYSRRNARAVLLQKASNDVRAVCFARLFLDRGDHATMLHCAELGCALAQAFLAEMSVGKEGSIGRV
jgi:hypothetical protein